MSVLSITDSSRFHQLNEPSTTISRSVNGVVTDRVPEQAVIERAKNRMRAVLRMFMNSGTLR